MTHRPPSTLFILLAVLAGPVVEGRALDPKGVEFFEESVRPLLVARCYECHSTENKIKGGLALDTRGAILKGGDSGPGLIAGDPEKSRIIEAVRYKNQDMQMPPKSPLPLAEIKVLEDWVRMGAPDPREGGSGVAHSKPHAVSIEEGRKFWAYRPLQEVALPDVGQPGAHPIDAFLLKALADKQLSPAPAAERRLLIRRATFDLTGLPPTPEEVEAFVTDAAPDAWERLIERLLASPQYGERWGRHWLDLARYADSNGLDENLALGHAWRYRDYVVRSFNEDKPYDRFVIEQIAGDLLSEADPATRQQNLTATGFLALGAKVLAEPDREKLLMDVIDEQIDTMGKALLGMTFGCARCHDHKSDPFEQQDYYAMAAIFRSTKSLGDDRTGAIKHWYEHSLATKEDVAAKTAHEAKVKEKTSELKSFTTKARAELKEELQTHAAGYLAAAARLSMSADYAEVCRIAAAHGLRPRYLLTCRQYLEKHREHPVFARWHELGGDSEKIAQHYSDLFARARAAYKDAVANTPAPRATTSAAAAPEPKARAAKALPGKKSPIADPVLAAAHDALNDIAGFLAIPDKDADAFDEKTVARIQRMSDDLMALSDQTPDPPAIMGVTDGDVTRALPIHIRGNHLTLGRAVERAFPRVMQAALTKRVLPAKQSGRLEFARWLASDENPLAARVFVNRVWRWHFGKGLVATTDNFGALGDRPSHPELLEWLARAFIENGWRIKDLHRLIMTSAAYQRDSQHPSAGAASSGADPLLVDPENRLLWRFDLQRLDAEQIRDSLLFVSGGLSDQIGGKTVPLRNKEFVFNHTSKDHTKYESPRRALYLPIIRNHLYDMLEQFDYPDPTMPTGSRSSTTVAPQALIMLNAPVVQDAAARLASRLRNETRSSDPARLAERAYALLFGRQPTARESERAAAFLQTDAEAALPLLCQTLLATNEFVFVR